MTDDQVREWAREAGLDWQRGFTLDNEKNRYAILARLARAEAYEAAAKVCDATPPQPFRPSIEAAHAIRALAEREKEPRP